LPEDFWKTYSAMANGDGGVVVLGAKERADGSFEVNGIGDVEKVERDLWNLLGNPQKVSVNVLGPGDVRRHVVDGGFLLEICIRAARRAEKPVHLNGNPFGNTWRRERDGDRLVDRDRVQRMIAEATVESRDGRVLGKFTRADLDASSIKTYRNVFSARRIDHPWNGLDDDEFLTRLGAWRKDRESGDEGLTAAGLLMFGQHQAIREVFSHYFVDYQERAADVATIQWVDRVYPDGTWSGNLYDFYRRVIARLTANLHVPFELDDNLHRRDETHVHEALREALVNTLIHADYDGRISILVVKRPDAFEFRNPGALRVPPEQIREGGVSDCRNRTLQQMFLMLGIGEQAGSGFSRILRAWKEQSWQAPLLRDDDTLDATTLVLRMVSFLPPQAIDAMRTRFGTEFERLDENGRLAVVTAWMEQQVTNRRLQELLPLHGRDLTYLLKDLVLRHLLVPHGERQGRFYTIFGRDLDSADPAPSVSEHSSEQIALAFEQSGGRSEQSSEQSGESSEQSGRSSEQSVQGSKQSVQAQATDANLLILLNKIAHTRWSPVEETRAAVLGYCRGAWRSLDEIAGVLKRSPSTIRTHHLRPLVDSGALLLRHPAQPTHPDQAYRTAEPVLIPEAP
jgi:predicted HTH transcriptional regulator